MNFITFIHTLIARIVIDSFEVLKFTSLVMKQSYENLLQFMSELTMEVSSVLSTTESRDGDERKPSFGCTYHFFAKEDNSVDSLFNEIPRIVTHINDSACMVLKGFYRSILKNGVSVLDLMSSWVSHLPEDIN